ncbi:MAG: dTDP-4-dehydrorhamnose 3,5-epimerase [Bacteroidetes bacterium]|nr:dTDP-4-dehydrorhamnose 3,5-epimerase [Bacteroidota bacterium]
MNIIETDITEVKIIEPRIFEDSRGYFFESFNEKIFKKKVCDTTFIQDNEAKSSYGVLRGLHYQLPPYAQSKLVRVIKGEVLDVAVDIRKGSPTFKKWVTVILNEENKRQLFVPRGFAHGYVVLSKEAIFAYKVDNRYAPEYERGIKYNDEDIKINWQIKDCKITLSDKDKNNQIMKLTEIFK